MTDTAAADRPGSATAPAAGSQAAPGRFAALLALQELDSAADRLAHRRRNLAERDAVVEVGTKLANAQKHQVQAAEAAAAARRASNHAEATLASHETRLTASESRLYSGNVVASRELSSLSAEVDSLRRRRGDLEERALEAMEVAEPLEAALAAANVEVAGLAAEQSESKAALVRAEAEIDQALAEGSDRRLEAAGAIDAELDGIYRKLRVSHGGIAVARLQKDRCGGCHLALPAMEVQSLRSLDPDALAYCDHCGRLLVRN
ncbi:MAG: zinc ribbon domain-containing protein [Acidimicrobiales bacterium]